MTKAKIESSILGLNKPSHITEDFVNLQVIKIHEIFKLNSAEGNDRSLFLKVISCLDLTSLNLDDTREVIEKLCLKAINPLGDGSVDKNLHTAAVCVHQARSKDATEIFKSKNIKNIAVAVVAGDFPTAKLPYEDRLKDVNAAAQSEVDEIDIVIDRSLVINEKWDELFKEISEMRRACCDKHMKTILSTGDLASIDQVYKASMIAMSAGSDFIKTSTGKETVNATLEVGVVMCEAIKQFHILTGRKVGLKPAGGIRTSDQALQWVFLVKENLGEEWLNKELFRIGASGLLDDLARKITTST